MEQYYTLKNCNKFKNNLVSTNLQVTPALMDQT